MVELPVRASCSPVMIETRAEVVGTAPRRETFCGIREPVTNATGSLVGFTGLAAGAVVFTATAGDFGAVAFVSSEAWARSGPKRTRTTNQTGEKPGLRR